MYIRIVKSMLNLCLARQELAMTLKSSLTQLKLKGKLSIFIRQPIALEIGWLHIFILKQENAWIKPRWLLKIFRLTTLR